MTDRFKGMLIENCMLCSGELKPASAGPYEHIYADYFYDETNVSKIEVGVYICPTCHFVLYDTRYWDGPNYSVAFAYDDKFLDQMCCMIKETPFESNNKFDPNYKKLVANLPQIKERIQGIKEGLINDPFEK